MHWRAKGLQGGSGLAPPGLFPPAVRSQRTPQPRHRSGASGWPSRVLLMWPCCFVPLGHTSSLGVCTGRQCRDSQRSWQAGELGVLEFCCFFSSLVRLHPFQTRLSSTPAGARGGTRSSCCSSMVSPQQCKQFTGDFVNSRFV